MSDGGTVKARIEGGVRTRGVVRESRPGEPLVSVVTVVRNGAVHLQQAIDSVLAQDWPNLEYILVDGGSTDGTLDIIRRHEARIDYWVSEPDRGIYDAMNKGIALASGDLIALLNADDWYEPGAVAAAAGAFARAQVEGIYYGNRYLVRDDLDHEFAHRASFKLWLGMTVGHQAMFVHHGVYSRLGNYALSYRWASDFDFLVRAVRAKVPFLPIGCFVVHFRDGGASTQNVEASLGEVRAVLGAAYGKASPMYVGNLLVTAFRHSVLRLKDVIRCTLGERMLLRLRAIYGRAVVARGKTVGKTGRNRGEP